MDDLLIMSNSNNPSCAVSLFSSEKFGNWTHSEKFENVRQGSASVFSQITSAAIQRIPHKGHVLYTY